MKILMLSPYVPYPPNSGGRIRQWEQIKYLGRRHDLTVVYFAFTPEEFAAQSAIGTFCSKAIAVKRYDVPTDEPADAQKLPWPVRMFGSDRMRTTLAELGPDGFDAVIIEFIFMSLYRDLFSGRAILQEHNIESSIFRQYSELPGISGEKIYGIRKNRAFWKATWMLMTEYENRTWPAFPLRVTVSEKDRREMETRCLSGRTIVVENGVNTREVPVVRNSTATKILFMGKMDYYPNSDAASFLVKSIMPFVWQKDPGISLCIAGMNPPQSVRALASDPRVEVIANPGDMCAVAAQCSLSVVPLRLGGGTRIKILDSMAMGLPVVSTSLGCEGLVIREGIDILIRDDPDQFADAVLRILSDDILARLLAANGRRLVEERYDWELIFERLEKQIYQLAAGTGGLRKEGRGELGD